jgi:acetyl-CoA carboxylase biotin carboxyl carrier protein
MFESWQARLHTIIDILETSDVNEIEVSFFGRKYRVTKSAPVENSLVSASASQMVQTAIPVDNRSLVSEPAPVSENVEITAPMVGTFYRAPSPESPFFVEEGDRVTAGQTLCIIEAMKIMNEIESEVTGRISKILMENAQAVEYGQALFVIEPD